MKTKLLAGLGLLAALALVVGAGTAGALGNGPPVNVNPKTTAIIDYVSPEFGGPQHPGPHGSGEEDPTPTPTPTPEPTHGDHFTLLGGTWADLDGTSPEVDPLLAFQIDLRGFPDGSGPALLAAFASWENVTKGNLLVASSFDDVVVDFGDGINTYSMRNLGGRVLAATFITYDDANNSGVLDEGDVLLEMDVVFNSTVKWAVDSTGVKGKWFDVQSVAAHEDGHVFGMGHVGNGIHTLEGDEEQTMYKSLASGETNKRSLEADGDIPGAQDPLLGYLAP